MRRSLLILLLLLLAGAAVFGGAYLLAGAWCRTYFARSTDDFDWLRREFRLNEAEMARIRELHAGYLPQCRGFCERIAAQQVELRASLGAGTNVNATVEEKLRNIAALRAQCQAAMLRHFLEVSRVMPPEQGRRYLAEMERLTLGAHEHVEETMSGEAASPHGRH